MNLELPVYPTSPLIITEEEFEMDRVAIGVHWTQESHENLLVSYNISIVPTIGSEATMISNTKANLTVLYNIPYNVSVVADLCGSQATTQIEIYYGECMLLLLLM